MKGLLLAGLAVTGSSSLYTTSDTTTTTRHMLEKIFDHSFLKSHELSSLSSFLHHHRASLRENERIPILGCGPTDSVIEKENYLRQLSSSYVDVATVLHDEDQTCLVAHLTPQEIEQAQDSIWQFDVFPPILKIHHSVLSYIEGAHLTTTTESTRELKSMEQTGHPSPEGMSLSIQYVRSGLQNPPEVLLADILKSWRHQTASLDVGKLKGGRGTSRWVNMEHNTHSRWTRIMDDASSSHHSLQRDAPCELPPSTQFEHESSVSRLNDMSEWQFTTSSQMETTKHSTYCFMQLVEAIAAHPSVLSMTVQGRPVLLNYDARGMIQSGYPSSTPFSDLGLLGEGQIVGVTDSGLDDYSCYFWDNSGAYSSPTTTRSSYTQPKVEQYRRKVVEYVAYADGYDPAAGHGTHVVGTIVGDSIFDGYTKANGVAPAAKVAFYDVMSSSAQYLSIPDTYTYVYTSLYNAGARVLSNSWGSYASETQYTERQYDADNFVYTKPDTLIVFAAGNSGADGYKSAYSPCTSKNVLCVGSVDLRDDASDDPIAPTDNRVSYFSSLGPTFDGRIKPDVAAHGFKVVSAMAAGPTGNEKSCATYETFGTSMAAPIVSGAALILREYFLEQYAKLCTTTYTYCKSFTPSGYLLKAILIHSAIPITRYSSPVFDSRTTIKSFSLSTPPDNLQGYGEVTLTNAVPTSVEEYSAQNLYVLDAFPVVGKKNYVLELDVQSSSKPLIVTIAWYDPPAGISTSSNLLGRNINLYVRHVASQAKWYGNNANYNQMDSTNPQERVWISSPQTGKYQVILSSPTTSYTTNVAVVVTCHGTVTAEPALYSGQLSELFSSDDISSEVEGTTSENIEPAVISLPSNFRSSYLPESLYIGGPLSTQISIPVDVTISPLNQICIHSFEITSTTDQLHSITMDLNGALHGGSSAFVLGILLTAPNGELVQVGGYLTYASSDRLWARMWPVQWAAATSPPDGSSRYLSTRFLLDADLLQVGTWNVCLEMLYENWPQTHYQGTITVNFIDTKTITSSSKTKAAFSSHFTNMTIALSVFFVGIIIAVVVGLGFRNHAATTQTAIKAKNAKSKPLASTDSQVEEAAMAPIRRKKGPSGTTEMSSYSIEDNENLNPILTEEESKGEPTESSSEELWRNRPVLSSDASTNDTGTPSRSMLSSMISARPKYQSV